MRKLSLAACAALVLFCTNIGGAEAGCKKTNYNPCPANPDPGLTYLGNQHPTDMIRVTVCVSPGLWKRYRSPKWWGPTMRWRGRGGGEDLPAVHARCSTRSVRAGVSIDTYADCLRRNVTTVVMWRSGTYTMH